jgi:DNA polymerase-3 subunit gamma/tau
VEGADAEIAELTELAGRADEARLRRMFRALLREQEDLAWAPDPFSVLEMAVVRCATLAPGDKVEELLARLDGLERRLAGAGGEPSGGGDRGSKPSEARRAAKAEPERKQAPKAEAAPSPAPARVAAAPVLAEAEEVLEEPGLDLAPPLPAVFDRLRSFAQEANRGLFSALEGGRLVTRTDETIRIGLPSVIAVRRLESRLDELAAVVERFFGRPLRVVLEAEGGPSEAARATGPDPLTKRRRQEALNHPAVNQALEILEGEILEIKSLGEGA